MNEVYLLLGGNIGEVSETFQQARQLIDAEAGLIRNFSSLYQSEAWGFESQSLFLNQALEIETSLSPFRLLKTLLFMETRLGRLRREGVMDSRNIDIDILLFNDLVIHTSLLVVPHPRLHLRRFTLVPLAEIAPAKVHPLMGKTIARLLDECADPLKVQKLDTADNATG